jgi:inorganic pyrophosphatase
MDIDNLPIGDEAPEIFNAVIEVPKGSHNKYEFDEKLGVFALDRVLYSPMHYPLDYGLIPSTHSEDGDHLDVLVIGGDPTFTGCVVRVRPIGLFKMIDGGDEDFKILGVQDDNPRLTTIKKLSDVKTFNPHLLDEIAHFFTVYKDLEKKEVKVLGWEDEVRAKEEIKRAQAAYSSQK